MAFISLFALNYAKNNLGPKEVQAKEPVSDPARENRPSRSARPPVPNSTLQPEQTGSWVHLPFTMDSKGNITVVHPVTNAILPLKELDLKVRRQGRQIYCYLEDYQ